MCGFMGADTAGAVDHVFGLCHLTGFRFAPRIRDLADRRLYVADVRSSYKSLDPMIGGAIDFRIIGENWDETLRLAASIKAGTVAPSILMRRLSAYPKQNALAKTLREIGRLERTLFTRDWISDPALRRRTNAGLNKGEARNALARAVFFHRLGEIRDRTFENQRYRASGLNLAVARPSSFGTRSISATPSPNCASMENGPVTIYSPISRRSAGSISPSTGTTFGRPSRYKMPSGLSETCALNYSTRLRCRNGPALN